jgi:uncharacterized RDD family membrane protein YckC
MYCAKCGTEVRDGGAFCSSCGAPAAAIPTTSPVAPATAAASYAPPVQVGWVPQSAVGYAGFWLRLVAHLIDHIVLGIPLTILIVFLILGTGLSAALQGLHPGESPEEVVAAIGVGVIFFGAVALIAAVWLHYALFESSTWQATPGKKVLGLFVTDLNGNRISFAHASGRFFAKLISGLIPLGIGYMMAGFTAKKQALHDMIAGCLVLRKI